MEIELEKFRQLGKKSTRKRHYFIFNLMCKNRYYSDRALFFLPHKFLGAKNITRYIQQHKSKILQNRFSIEPKVLNCGDNSFINYFYSQIEISLSQLENYFSQAPEKIKILSQTNVLSSETLIQIFSRNPKIIDNDLFRSTFTIGTRLSLGQFLKTVSGWNVDEKNVYWALTTMVDVGNSKKLFLARHLSSSGHKYSARKFLDAEIERRREKNKIFMENVKKLISELAEK